MSKKFMNVLKTMLAVMLIASCSAADEELKNTAAQTAENQAVYYENASLSLAKLVAETYLMEYETINEWENAVLAEPYPLYNPATEVITYLEYPVIKDGKRKGYIMVTLKEDEPRVVEASENSEMTNYEALADKAETNDIKAVRFSFASFVAEDPTVSRSGNRKVLAALGNIEHEIEIGEVTRSGSMYEEYINNYKAKVEENDGFLDINKDVYEANKEWIEYRNGQRTRGKALEDADLEPITEYLGKYSSSNYTLIANQFKLKNSKNETWNSGCVPTAGAIALAYYARKHNKPKLWRNCGTPDKCFIGDKATSEVDEKNFKSIVNELRKYLGMGEKVTSSITSKLPLKLSYYSYKNDCGWIPYQEIYSGKSWTCYGFKRLLRYLEENNPCFLGYYDHDEKGWHATVIYKAKVQRDWANNYKECTYYITTGWKSPETKSVNTWDWCISDISMQSYTQVK